MAGQKSIAEAVHHRVVMQPELYPVALDCYRRAGGGVLSVGDVDYKPLFLQSYRPRDPIVAGLLISFIHSLLVKGDLAAIQIEVGATPAKNAEMDENERLLLDLPEPFVAHVDGRPGRYDDGSIAWDPTAPDAPPLPAFQWPGGVDDIRVPLEIGNTDVETLWFHLLQCRGFARWPYEQDHIVLFRTVNRHVLELA